MSNDFFESIGKTITEAAKSVGDKTDEFIAIQKLRSRQSSLESDVKRGYRKIGELVFQKYVDGEPYSEEIAELCREIILMQSEIAEYKESIANKKGQTICPVCGAMAPEEAEFCMKCGASIPRPEKTEEADFTEAENQDPEDQEPEAEPVAETEAEEADVEEAEVEEAEAAPAAENEEIHNL